MDHTLTRAQSGEARLTSTGLNRGSHNDVQGPLYQQSLRWICDSEAELSQWRLQDCRSGFQSEPFPRTLPRATRRVTLPRRASDAGRCDVLDVRGGASPPDGPSSAPAGTSAPVRRHRSAAPLRRVWRSDPGRPAPGCEAAAADTGSLGSFGGFSYGSPCWCYRNTPMNRQQCRRHSIIHPAYTSGQILG